MIVDNAFAWKYIEIHQQGRSWFGFAASSNVSGVKQIRGVVTG